ncbi:MAG: YitT family protein [Lachnospiraceae bacterium]
MGKKRKHYAEKICIICIGSIVSAYGIDLAIHAGFGGATLAVLWQGISKTCNITMGQASLLVAALMILFCAFYDRHQLHIGTILYQLIYGFFVDFFESYMTYSSYGAVNFALMFLGIAIFAIGTGLYSFADFGRGSYEALTFAIAEKNHIRTRKVRIILDFSVVVAGVLLGGGFGLCTVFTVLMSGLLIQWTVEGLKKVSDRVTLKEKNQKDFL